MTKEDLTYGVQAKLKLKSKREALVIVDAVLNTMEKGLVQDRKLFLRDWIGIIDIRDQKENTNGRNPQTGEPIIIPKKKRAFFRPTEGFKGRLNK